MGILKRVAPRIRKGLSPSVVRLLTGEKEPVVVAHQAEKVHLEPAHLAGGAKKQVDRRLKNRVKRVASKRSS
jgi:hypothetical protein